jgi:hypothetical protein
MALLLQVVASMMAVLLVVPSIIVMVLIWYIPSRGSMISDIFHGWRRLFYRLLAGRALRPFTLRASLPSGPGIKRVARE